MNFVKSCKLLKVWLGYSVHTACNIATPEQMMLGKGVQQVELEENALGERCKCTDMETNIGARATVWEFLLQCNLTDCG